MSIDIAVVREFVDAGVAVPASIVAELLDRLEAAEELREALKECAEHIEAMMAHIDHKPQRFKEHCWSKAVMARAALAKARGES
ncbi:hypothetical protein [Phytohalomonas tamaricis]|uniref:hypothetical protein n=1 Tax=Phytohalomonas tamaricis TaxID=2081032 RepID=UPI000D0B653E|nr:hypothetical protein [Phytohalomonas tamaricis]